MSYYNCPDVYRHLSPDQISRTRTGLEDGNRHDLVSALAGRLRWGMQRRGSADAEAIDDVDAVRVGLSRIVTVAREGGTMRLVARDVSVDGDTVTRRGQATAGPVSIVAACPTGLGNLVTAVRDSEGVVRKASNSAGSVGALAIARVNRQGFATAVRTREGTLKVIVWRLVVAIGP